MSRLDQLIISGIPETFLMDRTAPSQSSAVSPQESSLAVIEAVMSLCTNKLGIPIDIQRTHRLKAGPHDVHRPILLFDS